MRFVVLVAIPLYVMPLVGLPRVSQLDIPMSEERPRSDVTQDYPSLLTLNSSLDARSVTRKMHMSRPRKHLRREQPSYMKVIRTPTNNNQHSLYRFAAFAKTDEIFMNFPTGVTLYGGSRQLFEGSARRKAPYSPIQSCFRYLLVVNPDNFHHRRCHEQAGSWFNLTGNGALCRCPCETLRCLNFAPAINPVETYRPT